MPTQPTQPALFPARTATTAQQLGALIKSARDLMRKDKGLNGDLDRLPMLTWIMFLKFLDDAERDREDEAVFKPNEPFKPLIEFPYRWRDWAADERGLSGPDLIAFINNDEAVRPDGERGAGLFAYLRGLPVEDENDRRAVVARVFRGTVNRMLDGYLLRDVISKVNGIHFSSSQEIHTLGHLYESLLKEMRDAAGDSGEFYTPRAVVRFMVEVVNPQLGEKILDPACGTGGFLCGSFEHLQKQVKSVADRQTLQREAIRGGEAKSLPYLLAQMNLLLHGLENPQIDFENSLARALGEITERDRVDLILTNPPFGGEEQRAILSNFPADRQTAETAWLFLQLIMRLLKRPQAAGLAHRRAAVVVPNGTLFSDGVGALIKKDLLAEFNLRTIVRLPPGVFAPYTNIQANILFFDCSGPTQNVWFYEMAPPAGRKNYSKTAPIQFEEFADCMAWWPNRVENERAWKVDWAKLHHDTEEKALAHREAEENAKEAASQAARRGREIESQLTALDRENGLFADAERAKRIEKLRQQRTALKKREIEAREEAKAEKATFDAIYWPIFNLDLKNPRAPQDAAHLPPAELLASIRQKEARLTGLLDEIGALLETAP